MPNRLTCRRFDRRLRVEWLERRDAPSAGYFRVVSYNVTSAGGSTAAGLNTILAAIGAEQVAGRAEPIDLIALQEVEQQTTTTQDVVNLLNGIYGAGTYSRGSLNGDSTGGGTQGVVFNTASLQLVAEAAVGTASTTGQPRQALRYQFQPVGLPPSAAFYVYNSHYKADSDIADQNRRLVEATAIRADSDALGNVPVLYVGDFNAYNSNEAFYQHLFGPGAGEAFDPINRPGPWHDNASFIDIFTQAPAVNPPPGLTGGGLDDRFDFQVFTNELTDGVGLDYVPGTYHTFGVNGSVGLNGNVNATTSTALPGLPNRLQVLDLLTTVADHLPVVADYRFPDNPPTVTVVQVNDGSAQRSVVTSLKVTFSEPVSFPSGTAAAFQLTRSGPGTPTGAVGLTAFAAGNSVNLSFTGGAVGLDPGGSLIDGNYTLTVVASKVQGAGGPLDGNGDGVGGDNFAVGLHRIFGDADGDRDVDVQDYGAFRGAFGLVSFTFDFDGDGDVDTQDYGAFRARFGTSV